jgi:hypothetical protein
MNLVHPLQGRGFRSKVQQLLPQLCPEEMLDERLKTLWPLGVPNPRIVFKIIGMVDETDAIHKRRRMRMKRLRA